MSDNNFPYKQFLSPKYWPMWLGFGILKTATLFPIRWSQAFGSGLGSLLFKLAGSRRRVAEINLRQAYPDYSDEQINQLNQDCFRSLGMSVIETGYAWYSSKKYLKKICTVEGKEHLDQAKAKGKGIILLTGHFTTVDMGAHMIGFYVSPYSGVYKKAHNPLFNAMMAHCRAKYGSAYNNLQMRGVMRGLKQGDATWYAPDQDFADQDIVFKPFLGGIASTLLSTAKMAKITGASVIPFYPVRMKQTRDNPYAFKMVILPPLENFPGDDLEEASARVNQSIDAMVYAQPEQYGWMHKRFKTTPDRKNNFYAKKS